MPPRHSASPPLDDENPPDENPLDERHLSARQAAELLGVRRETLYAYVSRGLLRSQEGGEGREKRYPREDVERLLARREERRTPAKAVAGALHFGAPVLESALTSITGGRLYYRGRDAVETSRTSRLEDVAAWLWLGPEAPDVAELFTAEPPPSPRSILGEKVLAPPWSLEALQAALPIFGAEDVAAWVTARPREVAASGARLLQRLARLAAGDLWRGGEGGGVASSLAAGWGADLGDAELLGAALVLCADHELNASAFTARCVASTGSPLASVVSAGLGALQGPKHGGHTRRVEALLREAERPENLRAALADRLRRGEAVPGYGQKLYPEGDPRYAELARRVRRHGKGDAAAWADALEDAGLELLGEHPTVDVGLVLVSRALGLPRGAALTLFALGRTAGWIAHALEQYDADRLIRPRARYVGEPPPEGGSGTEARSRSSSR